MGRLVAAFNHLRTAKVASAIGTFHGPVTQCVAVGVFGAIIQGILKRLLEPLTAYETADQNSC
jgi:hypothetical protein